MRAVERRHAILQLGELVGDVRGQQVAARGQRLAELHEDRAELLERERAGVRARGASPRRTAQVHGRQQEQEAQRPIQVRGAHEFVQAVAHQHALDLDEAGEDAQLHRGVSVFASCSSRRARASRRSRSSRSRSTPR